MICTLTKQRYAEIKNIAYQFYDIYHKVSGEDVNIILKFFLEKLFTDEEKTIFVNTLLCPFDMELCQALTNKSMVKDMTNVIKRFNIPKEIIDQKGYEYVMYKFTNCVGEGLIDHSIILEFSRKYLENMSDSQKKTQK